MRHVHWRQPICQNLDWFNNVIYLNCKTDVSYVIRQCFNYIPHGVFCLVLLLKSCSYYCNYSRPITVLSCSHCDGVVIVVNRWFAVETALSKSLLKVYYWKKEENVPQLSLICLNYQQSLQASEMFWKHKQPMLTNHSSCSPHVVSPWLQ